MHGPRPLYWTNPVAGLTFWTTVAIWGAAELRQSSRTRADATVQDQGSRWAVRLSIAGAWLIALRSATRLTSATIRTQSDLVFILALVVLWTGIGLRLWAFRTLGRYFTFTVMTSADQSVVSNGPYRIIRHPGYAGGALALIGLGLAMSNWVSLIALTAIPPLGYVRRIRVEEAALDATLGERYRGYAQGRKRLVPFVW